MLNMVHFPKSLSEYREFEEDSTLAFSRASESDAPADRTFSTTAASAVTVSTCEVDVRKDDLLFENM